LFQYKMACAYGGINIENKNLKRNNIADRWSAIF
jgi:hypothetical protein